MDQTTTIQTLKDHIQTFCDDRNWNQHHNAKDLAIGISTEAGELLDLFRFKNDEQSKDLFTNNREAITDEMSDVLFFLLRLAQRNNIDITTELLRKIEKSAKKYPIGKKF